MPKACYWYYLDASALVRLAVNEPGANDVRLYFNTNSGACATLVSFIEALGVLKRNWKDNWRDPNYHKAVEDLQIPVYGGKLDIDDTSFATPAIFREVAAFSQSHNLDFADALQLFAIKKGKYSPFTAGSNTRFISADNDLVRAARSNKILTWKCSKNGAPHWI
jgi:predicted nucleic acid-binding protein